MLLVSEDLDEVLALADRLLVMYEGAVVGELERAADGGGDRVPHARRADGRVIGSSAAEQPWWLAVAVPLGSLVAAFGTWRSSSR